MIAVAATEIIPLSGEWGVFGELRSTDVIEHYEVDGLSIEPCFCEGAFWETWAYDFTLFANSVRERQTPNGLTWALHIEFF